MSASVRDPLSSMDRAEVYRRDGGCIAPLVDPEAGPCRDGRRRIIDRRDPRGRTIDHVPPTLGASRVSSPRWMVWLCWGHHAHPSYWETAHREEERKYLWRIYEAPPWMLTVDEWAACQPARAYMAHRRA